MELIEPTSILAVQEHGLSPKPNAKAKATTDGCSAIAIPSNGNGAA